MCYGGASVTCATEVCCVSAGVQTNPSYSTREEEQKGLDVFRRSTLLARICRMQIFYGGNLRGHITGPHVYIIPVAYSLLLCGVFFILWLLPS